MTNCLAQPRISKDNKGSAIITVVVTMLFVVALGTALMYAAYLGLRVSSISRSDKNNFYDASAAMDELKAGVQNEVSSALKASYTAALVKYGQDSDPDGGFVAQDYLEQKFIDSLGKIDRATGSVKNSTGDGTFGTSLNNGEYDITVNADSLKTYLSHPDNVTLTVSDSAIWDAEKDTVTVSGLTVKYVGGDDFESDVSTDLVIYIPQFFTGSAVDRDFGDYATVAQKGIIGMGSAEIHGGVFAGVFGGTNNYKNDSIRTNGSGDKLTIQSGKIVTTGAVDVLDDTEINLNSVNYDIWTGELNAGKNSKLSVNGATYVADDLVLNSGSEVTLTGSYYGFGSSDASSKEANRDKTSSSVLVNSYKKDNPAKLNVSKLDMLTLAGVTFIDAFNADIDADGTVSKTGVNLPTGQSVAVKTDQLAYLVPADCISNYKTNPAHVADKNKIVAPVINYNASLWQTSNNQGRSLRYYLGSGNEKGSVVSYYTQTTGNGCDVYFFLSFKDQSAANEYFRDYFTYRPNAIEQYLDVYLNLSDTTNMSAVTKGSSYKYQNGSWGLISGTAYNSQAQNYAGTYSEKCRSPFGKFVNTENLGKLSNSNTLEFTQGGKVVAIVAGGDYVYDSNSPRTIQVIIAKGNVTIKNSDYTGAIFCGGVLTDIGHLITGVSYTDNIRDAVCTNGAVSGTLGNYLLGTSNSGDAEDENMWSPDKLVVYSNWQKN